MPVATHELTGTSSRYECRIKVEYHKDIMSLIEEGMLVAVRNFKSTQKQQRYSLMVISRIWPEHYGLKGLSEHSYYPMQFEIIQQSVRDWDTSDKSTMMVQISALPINYDLLIDGDGEPRYDKGFSYPVIAAEANILNRDISSEYPFLLMDLFADEKIPSKIILENPVTSAEQFYVSVVKPRDYENDDRVRKVFARIFSQKKISYCLKPESKIPTYGDILDELGKMRGDNLEKPHYINALDRIRQFVSDYKHENEKTDSTFVNEEFLIGLDQAGQSAVKEFSISDRSGVYSWARSRLALTENIKRADKEKKSAGGLDIEGIRDLVEKESRLTCISISEPVAIKELVIHLAREFLQRRKRSFKVKPYVLFVFDEAQEFVPDLSGSGGIDKDCSRTVETLLRQGRKYGLGGCLATQRIAYLNTNALQQLHTYFVGTLPRPYDRTVVSDTFTIDKQILEKTLEFAPGEWLLSSFIATGMENVPIFIRADNAETEVEKTLDKLAGGARFETER